MGVFMNIRKWELALAIGLTASLLFGLYNLHRDAEMAHKVVRLHVLAASDSDEDQALKLKVRDSVLQAAEPLLKDCNTSSDAQAVLMENLESIENAGRNTIQAEGYDYSVHAELEKTAFPTREYGDFALPAGRYTALRVLIGKGEGKNWWCVVFPPLCAAAATEELPEVAEAGGLNEEDIKLISQDNGEYVVRFKVLEWIGELKKRFGN